MNWIGYLGASLIGGVVLLGQGEDPGGRQASTSSPGMRQVSSPAFISQGWRRGIILKV